MEKFVDREEEMRFLEEQYSSRSASHIEAFSIKLPANMAEDILLDSLYKGFSINLIIG